MKLAATVACAVLIAGCSSLSVITGAAKEGGVPFYLSQHEFVIAELGLDENGDTATKPFPLRVSLVRRADPTRMFLVNHNAALLSESEFSVERDEEGRLVSIFGRSDEKTIETVRALASLVVSAAAAAATGRSERDIKDEQTTQQATHTKLLKALENTDDPVKIKQIQESLALTQERLTTLDKELKALGAAKAKIGTVASAHLKVTKVRAVASKDEAEGEARKLGSGEVGIFLVPVK